MPPYDGYADVADYITRRAKERGIPHRHLDARLGKSSNYIYRIVSGQMLPSPDMAAAIAAELGDDHQTIRILMGLETPPADAAAVALARKILRLPKREREVLEKIVEKLAG
jgi:cyanate lyase